MRNLLDVLTGSSVEEALRFAYAASCLMPAGVVVGGAAVLAGLLGAAGMRKVRAARPPERAQPTVVPWVLGVMVLASGVGPVPATAAVLCRKGESSRFVLRADACRRHEQAIEPRALGLDRGISCLDTVRLAWRELDALRARLEGTQDLLARLEQQPWDGADVWLALEGVALGQQVDHLARLADELGVPRAAEPMAQLRQLVTDGWGSPAEACAAALALLPTLEAALPVPPAL